LIVILDKLKTAAEFAAMRNSKLKAITKPCVISCSELVTESSESSVKIGFIVSKKNGGAVHRNRIKRRLRAASREVFMNADKSLCNRSYVLIGRKPCLEMKFSEIISELNKGLNYLRKQVAKP
jgi:ribonuclease P protein component